jgi:hypothetical protein
MKESQNKFETRKIEAYSLHSPRSLSLFLEIQVFAEMKESGNTVENKENRSLFTRSLSLFLKQVF